jgi:hypothetical protein
MCTVAFLPYKNKYYFASLRDESPMRKLALHPAIYNTNGVDIMSPLDGFAGGTWVGTNYFGNIIVLLNGGFENHFRAKGYRLSRGLIVKALLLEEAPVSAWQQIDLLGVEPFTLIVWQQQQLVELVWDGEQKYCQQLAITTPNIWSSSTLYNSGAKQQRKAAFHQWWATQPNVTKHSILDFFRSLIDERDGFLINRGPTMKTLSYTLLVQDNNATTCYYHDFSNSNDSTEQLLIKQLSVVF